MAKEQTIIRMKHGRTSPYLVISRNTAQDSQLSFAARGMLFYLLSKPDDWELKKYDLMREGDCGIDKINSLIKELRAKRYLAIQRVKGDGGKFTGVCWVVYEIPYDEGEVEDDPQPEPDNDPQPQGDQEPEKLQVGDAVDGDHHPMKNPSHGKPITRPTHDVENPLQHNKDIKQNTEQPPVKEEITVPEVVRPNIFKLYEDLCGMIRGGLIVDELKDIEKTYAGDWVVDAFKEATLQNIRKLAYVKAILQRWSIEGKSSPRAMKPIPAPSPPTRHPAPQIEELNSDWTPEALERASRLMREAKAKLTAGSATS